MQLVYILSAFGWNCMAVEYLYNHWVNNSWVWLESVHVARCTWYNPLWSSCSWLIVIMSFFRVLQFPPPIKLNPIILLKLALNILKSYLSLEYLYFVVENYTKPTWWMDVGFFFILLYKDIYLYLFVIIYMVHTINIYHVLQLEELTHRLFYN